MADAKKLCSHREPIVMLTETEIKASIKCFFCSKTPTHVVELCYVMATIKMHSKENYPLCTAHKEEYLGYWKNLQYGEILKITELPTGKS